MRPFVRGGAGGWLAALCLAVLSWSACEYSQSGPPGPVDVVESREDRVFITDRTGKQWDVTHARDRYGFKPSQFQFGLGPDAIRPIDGPQMLAVGDEDYPSDKGNFLVLGASITGEERAYPIGVMSRHEVANEVFGEAHVAVAY